MSDNIKDAVESDAPAEVRIGRLWWVVSAIGALLLVILLALVIVYRQSNKPFGFEVEWMSELVEARSPVWTIPALVFNWVGGGISSIVYVPLTIIAALLIWRRPWAALYYAIAAATSATVVLIIKNLVGRPRPADILVTPDFGSFPSGHSANAALIATALGIIFLRTWIWVTGAVYTLLMMLSRTYLGAHWISDTVGGMLVGVGVAIIIWAPFAKQLYRERRLPHPPIWVKVDRHPATPDAAAPTSPDAAAPTSPDAPAPTTLDAPHPDGPDAARPASPDAPRDA